MNDVMVSYVQMYMAILCLLVSIDYVFAASQLRSIALVG